MNKKVKLILGVLIFVLFFIIAYFSYMSLMSNYKADKKEPIGTTSPVLLSNKNKAKDFTVFDLEGNMVKLSDFAGKPIVLNFWASWCPPCKSEMPHFNKVYADVKDDIVFMMVDLVDGQRETQEKGQQYIDKQNYNFPVYFDNEQQAAYAYKISSIPTTFFIDSKGMIIKSYIGAIDEKTLITGINLIR